MFSIGFSLTKIVCEPIQESVQLFPMAEELFKELESLSIIDRLQKISQLGDIYQSNEKHQTRYNHLVLQMYLHKIAGKNIGKNLPNSYNSCINETFTFEENGNDCPFKEIQIRELMQIMVLAFGIGHFFNTFTASRAALLFAKSSTTFKNSILDGISDCWARRSAEKIISRQDISHFHFVNSLIILSRCNQALRSVKISKKLIVAFLNREQLPKDSKLSGVFHLYKTIRDISFISLDLQNQRIPIKMDVQNEKSISFLLNERLSQYNDNKPYVSLLSSVKKMLDDAVYYDPETQILSYARAKKIYKKLLSGYHESLDYFDQYFLNPKSVFNYRFKVKKDFDSNNILKLTFTKNEQLKTEKIVQQLDKIKGVRIGQYSRHSGELTILVALSKSSKNKRKTAFRLLACLTNHLKALGVVPQDHRYLLTVKFFLYYLANERPVVIDPTVDTEICVLCVRGSRMRVACIDKLLEKEHGSSDQRHEVEFLRSILKDDSKNDVGILIPASIKYDISLADHRSFHELDGLIMYPNRQNDQVVFLEAKNTNSQRTKGKQELEKALQDMGVVFLPEKEKMVRRDTFIKWTVE